MSDDSSSSESSDNEADVNEDQLREQVSALQLHLKEFPASYDTHVELIRALRMLGNLDELRIARESMNAIYPLSPVLWLNWIEDERKIAVSDDDKRKVECLFKRAIDDYDDLSVWLEYCLFAIGNLRSQDVESVQATEAIFDMALAHHGLNVAGANSLWDAYRDFLLVLYQCRKNSSQPADEYLTRIDKLYRRQLRIPLIGMQQTLDSYKEFRTGLGAGLFSGENNNSDLPADCLEEFMEASRLLELLIPFEDKIEEVATADLAQSTPAWLAYLDWIITYHTPDTPDKAGGKRKTQVPAGARPFSPNHICCLFERAVTAICLHPPVWLRFAEYLDDNLPSDRQRALRVLARSVRNCPWCVDLWLNYALVSECWVLEELANDASSNGLVEHTQRSAEHTAFVKVDAIFETAFAAGLDQQIDLIRLWLAYADYQLRRILRTEPQSPDRESLVENLRSTFERGAESLQQLFGHQADPDAVLGQYHAFIEAKHIGDMGRARSVWAQLMQHPGRGSQVRFWIAYLQFERNWGDWKHFSRISRMAVNSITSDATDSSFDTVLRLASESGLPVTQYRELAARIRLRRADLRRRAAASQMEVGSEESAQSNRKRPAAAADSDGHKPKIPKPNAAQSEPKPKPSDSQPHPAGAPKHGEFVSHDPSKDELTVFVSNLDYATTEDVLRNKFEQCGPLKSVRLVRDYAGRSKGFAYVEFETAESARRALEKDREPLSLGKEDSGGYARPMFVSVCDPSRTKTAAFHYAVGIKEPQKLFVRNLHKQVTTAELEKLFGQHGTVVSVRLATYRNGAPKGHAYVEFSNPDEASRALVATDGTMLGNKVISVAISNPPVRDGPTGMAPKAERSASSTDQAPAVRSEFKNPSVPAARTHARTQLAFLPRAISRQAGAEPGESNGSSHPISTPSESSSKTNDDFRNLVLSGRKA